MSETVFTLAARLENRAGDAGRTTADAEHSSAADRALELDPDPAVRAEYYDLLDGRPDRRVASDGGQEVAADEDDTPDEDDEGVVAGIALKSDVD